VSLREHNEGRGDVKPLSQACKDALAFIDKHVTVDIEMGDHQELKANLDTLVNRGLVLTHVYKSCGKTFFHYAINEPLPVNTNHGPRVNWKAIKGCGHFAAWDHAWAGSPQDKGARS
jgi:hypothetical protein